MVGDSLRDQFDTDKQTLIRNYENYASTLHTGLPKIFGEMFFILNQIQYRIKTLDSRTIQRFQSRYNFFLGNLQDFFKNLDRFDEQSYSKFKKDIEKLSPRRGILGLWTKKYSSTFNHLKSMHDNLVNNIHEILRLINYEIKMFNDQIMPFLLNYDSYQNNEDLLRLIQIQEQQLEKLKQLVLVVDNSERNWVKELENRGYDSLFKSVKEEEKERKSGEINADFAHLILILEQILTFSVEISELKGYKARDIFAVGSNGEGRRLVGIIVIIEVVEEILKIFVDNTVDQVFTLLNELISRINLSISNQNKIPEDEFLKFCFAIRLLTYSEIFIMILEGVDEEDEKFGPMRECRSSLSWVIRAYFSEIKRHFETEYSPISRSKRLRVDETLRIVLEILEVEDEGDVDSPETPKGAENETNFDGLIVARFSEFRIWFEEHSDSISQELSDYLISIDSEMFRGREDLIDIVFDIFSIVLVRSESIWSSYCVNQQGKSEKLRIYLLTIKGSLQGNLNEFTSFNIGVIIGVIDMIIGHFYSSGEIRDLVENIFEIRGNPRLEDTFHRINIKILGNINSPIVIGDNNSLGNNKVSTGDDISSVSTINSNNKNSFNGGNNPPNPPGPGPTPPGPSPPNPEQEKLNVLLRWIIKVNARVETNLVVENKFSMEVLSLLVEGKWGTFRSIIGKFDGNETYIKILTQFEIFLIEVITIFDRVNQEQQNSRIVLSREEKIYLGRIYDNFVQFVGKNLEDKSKNLLNDFLIILSNVIGSKNQQDKDGNTISLPIDILKSVNVSESSLRVLISKFAAEEKKVYDVQINLFKLLRDLHLSYRDYGDGAQVIPKDWDNFIKILKKYIVEVRKVIDKKFLGNKPLLEARNEIIARCARVFTEEQFQSYNLSVLEGFKERLKANSAYNKESNYQDYRIQGNYEILKRFIDLLGLHNNLKDGKTSSDILRDVLDSIDITENNKKKTISTISANYNRARLIYDMIAQLYQYYRQVHGDLIKLYEDKR